MTYNNKNMPNRNGLIHESIIDTLRFNLPRLIEDRFDEFFCIADEGLMAGFCNNGNQKGERPDLVLGCGDQFIYIEVGHMPMNKWEESEIPLIHISHFKSVGLVNGKYSETVKIVLDSIRELLGVN